MAHTTGTTDRASEDHKAREDDERNPENGFETEADVGI